MKGQTQALTAVLITTVTVGAIASAYVWGTPLLEKQQQRSQLESFEHEVRSIMEQGVQVARSGQGTTKRTSIELGSGEVRVLDSEDAIEVTTTFSEPFYSQSWTILEGENLQNVSIGAGKYALKGRDSMNVLLARSSGSQITYRIEYRNLRSGSTVETVDLQSVGKNVSKGETTVVMENRGTTRGTIEINQNTLDLKKTVLRVDLE